MRYTDEDYEQVFRDMDANGDHRITLPELYGYLEEHKFSPDYDRVKTMLRRFDTNRNGVLEKGEFIAMMQAIFADEIM